MNIVWVSGGKIIFAAAGTLDWFADLVYGAQVEDERRLLGEDFPAELAHHLQAANATKSNIQTPAERNSTVQDSARQEVN